MNKKFDIIINITNKCNFNCSYCDVKKNDNYFLIENIGKLVDFLIINRESINYIKFFGGEPLLNWIIIKKIIDKTKNIFGGKYIIVTNGILINEEHIFYFKKYFYNIFISLDCENNLLEKLDLFKFNKLGDKYFFNFIVDPEKIDESEKMFFSIYKKGYKRYNILPVYYTKEWKKINLKSFSVFMKKILDLSLQDKNLILYGFQENKGENQKLINHSIFVDIDLNIYYSDLILTNKGIALKEKLFLNKLENFKINGLNSIKIIEKEKIINKFEKDILLMLKGQKELLNLMDYFSIYLNISIKNE